MSRTPSGRPILSAVNRAFAALKKGVSKVIPETSIPCSAITLKARMLSRPPEKSAIAFVFNANPPSVSDDTSSPAVVEKRQDSGRHIEIDQINRFPLVHHLKGGKRARKSRAFALFGNPKGEITEGDGDSQPLKHAFDKGPALIVFSDRDHLLTRLLEDVKELFGQPLRMEDELLFPLPDEQIGRDGEVESVSG